MTHYALFSGGYDSLVATHLCMTSGNTSEVLFLDTNTGIPENREFVEEVCDQYGWPLRVEEAPMTLREFAKEWGFPGPHAHKWAYRWFKERALGSVATDDDGDTHFWTGVRRSESRRRMQTVEDEKDTGRWVWHAPIADWTKKDCDGYQENNDLPESEVVENIHRSGECFCGAFATRDEELIDLQAHYPDHFEWLMQVEADVQEEIGTDEEWCFWGHTGQSSAELQALAESKDGMYLCRDCFGDSMGVDW